MKKAIIIIFFVLCLFSAMLARDAYKLYEGGNTESPAIDTGNLEDKTLQDLYLMRNSIYARHGKPFKTHELHFYFMEQPWYHLKTDFSDSVLSKKELNQSELIIKKEKELMKQNYLTKNGKTVINFNNIINRWQYSDFTKADKIKLSTNGFLIMQAKHEQLFRVYEDNSYKERASFVTTDSMLQLYHMYFDFILRNIERDSLLPALKDLTENMFDASK